MLRFSLPELMSYTFNLEKLQANNWLPITSSPWGPDPTLDTKTDTLPWQSTSKTCPILELETKYLLVSEW